MIFILDHIFKEKQFGYKAPAFPQTQKEEVAKGNDIADEVEEEEGLSQGEDDEEVYSTIQ